MYALHKKYIQACIHKSLSHIRFQLPTVPAFISPPPAPLPRRAIARTWNLQCIELFWCRKQPWGGYGMRWSTDTNDKDYKIKISYNIKSYQIISNQYKTKAGYTTNVIKNKIICPLKLELLLLLDGFIFWKHSTGSYSKFHHFNFGGGESKCCKDKGNPSSPGH